MPPLFLTTYLLGALDTAELAALSFSAIALLISVAALAVNWLTYTRSNRPFVVASLVAESPGPKEIPFNLRIENAGTQPAFNVRLGVDSLVLSESFRSRSDRELVERVQSCFGDEATIPTLPPGVVSFAAFGKTSRTDEFGATWEWGTRIPIRILYEGPFGAEYFEEGVLIIKDLFGFAGHRWHPPAPAG